MSRKFQGLNINHHKMERNRYESFKLHTSAKLGRQSNGSRRHHLLEIRNEKVKGLISIVLKCDLRSFSKSDEYYVRVSGFVFNSFQGNFLQQVLWTFKKLEVTEQLNKVMVCFVAFVEAPTHIQLNIRNKAETKTIARSSRQPQ